jgi:hypothetical protein
MQLVFVLFYYYSSHTEDRGRGEPRHYVSIVCYMTLYHAQASDSMAALDGEYDTAVVEISWGSEV